jgi:hypothetical protein
VWPAYDASVLRIELERAFGAAPRKMLGESNLPIGGRCGTRANWFSACLLHGPSFRARSGRPNKQIKW